jgi:hypothetical protein
MTLFFRGLHSNFNRRLTSARFAVIWFFAGMVCLCAPSQAEIPGTPEEDAFIADAQNRFRNGRVPAVEELLNRSFYCIEREARPGDYRSYEQEILTFSGPGDGHVIAHQKNDVSNNQIYTDTGREWSMSMNEADRETLTYESFRMDSNGILIREYSKVKRTTTGPQFYGLKPIGFAPDRARVATYAICQSVPRVQGASSGPDCPKP